MEDVPDPTIQEPTDAIVRITTSAICGTEWAVEALAKAGTLGIIGIYPPTMTSFPIGAATDEDLTVNMGSCNHRRHLPRLIDLVASGAMGLAADISQQEDLPGVIDAYEQLDQQAHGWLGVAFSV